MSEIRYNSGSAPIDTTPELIDLRPLPKPMPVWLKTGLAAALAVAVVGWSLYGGAGSEHIETATLPPIRSNDEQSELKLAQQQAAKYQELLEAERQQGNRDPLVQDLLARERARSRAVEQLALRRDDAHLLVEEQAHSKELERQLASDRALLARERARNKELEQQLAARERDQELLAEERARSKELAQQLELRKNDRDQVAREQARNKELEQQLAARERDQELLAKERAQSKELEQQLVLRQNDRDQVAREWARSKELAQQLAALRGNDQDLLALERTRNKELEQQLAARERDQELLAQERAHSKELEQQLAERPDAAPAQASLPLPPLVEPSEWPAMVPAQRPTTADAARLIARARVLIAQGDIGGARLVLERAAEAGSAPAVFALAETYDSAILSAWGTFGTQGDNERAQQLYAEAFAAGIQEARARLKEP
jgi:hypothetical protein